MTKKTSKTNDCATDFSDCDSKVTKSFMYSMADVPTCGAWVAYCFGLAVVQYDEDRGECKKAVFKCLGIQEQ